jgi:hypothetical protein
MGYTNGRNTLFAPQISSRPRQHWGSGPQTSVNCGAEFETSEEALRETIVFGMAIIDGEVDGLTIEDL